MCQKVSAGNRKDYPRRRWKVDLQNLGMRLIRRLRRDAAFTGDKPRLLEQPTSTDSISTTTTSFTAFCQLLQFP